MKNTFFSYALVVSALISSGINHKAHYKFDTRGNQRYLERECSCPPRKVNDEGTCLRCRVHVEQPAHANLVHVFRAELSK